MDNERVTDFLQYWAKLYKANPTKSFTYKQVYKELTRIGVPENERLVDLRQHPSRYYPNINVNPSRISPICHPQSAFNNLIQIFSLSRNTDCFVQSNWNYFCQFISRDNKARCASQHIKMYIPLDEKHIEQGTKQIMGYLDDNKISHVSKIGSNIRFDDVVVRLIDPNDADKLLEFIKNNPYIQEGLIKPNPFAFQQDGIAMAVDGYQSYNKTTAQLIRMYMEDCRKNNRLDQVNAKDYQQFIRAKYQQQFLVHNNDDLQNELGWDDEESEKNTREILALMIQTSKPKFNYGEFLKHYATCADIELLDEKQIMIVNRLMAEAIEAMTEKYGHPEGYDCVKTFFYGGRDTLITRKNELRNRMVNGPFRDVLRRVLQIKKYSYDEYAQMIIEQYHLDLEEIARRNIGK